MRRKLAASMLERRNKIIITCLIIIIAFLMSSSCKQEERQIALNWGIEKNILPPKFLKISDNKLVEHIIELILAAIILPAVFWLEYRARHRKRDRYAKWNTLLPPIAKLFALNIRSYKEGYDSLNGRIAGLEVCVSIRAKDIDSPDQLYVEVGVENHHYGFDIRSSKTAMPEAKNRFKTGDARLDAVVAFINLPAFLKRAFREDKDFCELAHIAMIDLGAKFIGGNFEYWGVIPVTQNELQNIFEPIARFAVALRRPCGSVETLSISAESHQKFRGWDDMDSTEAMLVLADFGNSIKRELSGGKIVSFPKDGRVEWRGEVGGIPMHIKFSNDDSVKVNAKIINQIGDIDLEFDPTVEDSEKSNVWSDDGSRRVFVGTGIFVEGDAAETEGYRKRFESLPPEVAKSILEIMRLEDIIMFRIRHTVEIDFGINIESMLDPLDSILRLVRLIAKIGLVVKSPTTPSHRA